jgi:hypothetical protein
VCALFAKKLEMAVPRRLVTSTSTNGYLGRSGGAESRPAVRRPRGHRFASRGSRSREFHWNHGQRLRNGSCRTKMPSDRSSLIRNGGCAGGRTKHHAGTASLAVDSRRRHETGGVHSLSVAGAEGCSSLKCGSGVGAAPRLESNFQRTVSKLSTRISIVMLGASGPKNRYHSGCAFGEILRASVGVP